MKQPIKQKPFRYKRSRIGNPMPSGNFHFPALKPVEQFAGVIDGLKAAKGEENLYHAAYKTGLVVGHKFRLAVGSPREKPGWKELDFLFLTNSGNYVAIQVRDFTFVHKGAAATASDVFDDTYILQNLKQQGIVPKDDKIYVLDNVDLQTAESAEKAVEKILL